MNRRDVLCSSLAFLASPSLARAAPVAAIADYESASGGRIGLCVENLRTAAKVEWRADERFVMCSRIEFRSRPLKNADQEGTNWPDAPGARSLFHAGSD